MMKFLMLSAITIGVLAILLYSGKKTSEASSQAASSPAKTVFIDPLTGELTSSPSEEAMAEMSAHTLQLKQQRIGALQEFTDENGMVGVRLDGRFNKTLVATISDSGELALEHSNGSVTVDEGAIQTAPIQNDSKED